MAHPAGRSAMAGVVMVLLGTACVTLPGITAPRGTGNTGSGGQTGDSNTYTASPSPTPTSTGGTGPAPAVPIYTSWLHQSNGVLMDANNTPVVLRGVGWYGFELAPMLNLPSTPNRLGTDVATVAQRLHLMGVNTVHFSFSFSQLYNSSGYVTSPSPAATPCGGVSDANAIIQSVTISGFAPGPGATLLTDLPSASDGYCNDYLPGTGFPVVQRFAEIIDIFTRNNFYVVLEEHVDKDPALTANPPDFASAWSTLVADLVKFGGAYENVSQPSCTTNPNHNPLSICRNLILGLMWNADQLQTPLTWEADPNNRNWGAHQLNTEALFALQPNIPRAMFIVSGAWQPAYVSTSSLGVNWNDTYFPSQNGPAAVGSATGFFGDLLNTSVESQVMFGFTAFGPMTNTNLQPYVGDMPAQVTSDFDNGNFGTLTYVGVPDYSQTLHKFPVVAVTMGGDPSTSGDQAFLNALQGYMVSRDMPHFLWYCWNGQTMTGSGVTDGQYYMNLQPGVMGYLKAYGLMPAQH